jgi:hypothetical protein
MQTPIECNYCGGPSHWQLENATDNWDFYRACCDGPCQRVSSSVSAAGAAEVSVWVEVGKEKGKLLRRHHLHLLNRGH